MHLRIPYHTYPVSNQRFQTGARTRYVARLTRNNDARYIIDITTERSSIVTVIEYIHCAPRIGIGGLMRLFS